MSIRSNVGLAVKKRALKKLDLIIRNVISSYSDKVVVGKEGKLFYMENIRSGTVDEIVKELLNCKPEDYLLVEACFNYPEDDSNCIGGWKDNPWKLRRVLSANIAFLWEE